MLRASFLSALGLVALAASCLPIDLEGRPCESSNDCVDGYRCIDGTCQGDREDDDAGFTACDARYLPAGKCESDVEGTWLFQSACVGEGTTFPKPDTGLESCPGLAVTAIRTDVQGNLTFGSDGSYNSGLSGTVEWQVDVPAVCTGGVQCSVLQLGVGDGTASCTSDGAGGCTCLGLETDYDRFEPVGDSYSASGGEVVLSGDTSFRLSVCVAGSSMLAAEVSGEDVGPTLLFYR